MIAATIVGAALVLLVVAVVAWFLLSRVLQAIARQLPDEGMSGQPIGRRVCFSGYNPRPQLEHRRDEIQRDIQVGREQLTHVNAQIEALGRGADVVPFDATRRAAR